MLLNINIIMSIKMKSYIYLLLAVCLFAGLYPVNKQLMLFFKYPFTVSFVRMSIATVVFWLIYRCNVINELRETQPIMRLQIFLSGFLGIFIGQGVSHVSLRYVDANISAILENFYVVAVFMFSYFIFKLRFNYKEILGVLLNLAGTGIIMTGRAELVSESNVQELPYLGEVLALVAAFGYGYYFIAAKYCEIYKFNTVSFIILTYLTASVLLLPAAIWENGGFEVMVSNLCRQRDNWEFIIPMTYNILGVSLLCYFLLIKSSKSLGPLKTAIFLNLFPIAAVAMSAVFLKEVVTYFTLAGSIISIAGVTLVTVAKKNRQQSA